MRKVFVCYNLIFSLQDPGKWTAEFNDFVEQCLTMDAEQRPSAEALLKHSFLRKADDHLTMPKGLLSLCFVFGLIFLF